MIRGKVVLVPFPFDDLASSKVCPAVCLTEPVGPYKHVVLAFVTSRIPIDLADTDLVLRPDKASFAATGLQVLSPLRLHRMVTVTTTLIRRELGELSPEIQIQVSDRLRILFELS